LTYTALKMINFWYKSHSRWLTFSHFSFITASVLSHKI